LQVKDKEAKDKTRLKFPEGALDEENLISMLITTDCESSVYFEFGPDGSQFDIPVVLELSWKSLPSDVNADDLILYRYDDNNDEWVEEAHGEWHNGHKKVTLHIDHFSKYYFDRP